MATSLLFMGIPGGMELLVVLFVFALPLLLVGLLGVFLLPRLRGGDGEEERIAELEDEVEELRREVERRN